MIYTVTLNPTLDRTLHFPSLRVGALNRASGVRTDLSGKGVNVSVALQGLGVPSVIIGLAAGITGDLLIEGIKAQGFDCHFVRVAGEIRSNITVIDDERGEMTKLNEPGPTVSKADLVAFEALPSELVERGDTVVMSGNLPPGAPPDTYATLVTSVRALGARAVVDTSGAALSATCFSTPDLIKPNDVEAESLTGLPLETDAQCLTGLDALLAMGPHEVLLSLGAPGAMLANADGVWHAQPPQIREVSAIGAGDSALAGLLYARSVGMAPQDEVAWAVATGTAAASLDGTLLPDLRQVQDMIKGVSVRRLR